MSRAQKWRICLIGGPTTINLLRRTKIQMKKRSGYFEDIQKDLKRTYPMDEFFTNHIGDLSCILNNYAYVNEGMGYAQGMAFLAFNLFRVFYEDDPVYAVEDTFYSFHKLVHVVRPAYPLSTKDQKVLVFNKNSALCVHLLIAKRSTELATKVKEIAIVDIFIQQVLPSMFGTKFITEDCAILFDFIIEKRTFDMFHRILCIIAAMILSIDKVIMNMSYESILGIMQHRGCYKVRRVIAIAYSIL